MGHEWGYSVIGTKEPASRTTVSEQTTAKVNNLSGLIKRKRTVSQDLGAKGVNVLSTGLVKKKKKEDQGNDGLEVGDGEGVGNGVNVLGDGLVRKKAKE